MNTYTFNCYSSYGHFTGFEVEVTVKAKDEASALKKVKSAIDRDQYSLIKVIL